jgi:pyridoxine kinase
MGDNNALYVPEAFVAIYRDSLLHLSDIATPNQTEAELLSGIPIRDLASAYANLHWFHARGVRTVILTSMSFPTDSDASSEQLIQVMASTISDLSDPYPTQYAHMQFRKVPTYFSGTGDLTTALLLAWLVKNRDKAQSGLATTTASGVFSFATLVRSLELTMATLQAVIHRTAEAQSEELLLIQSKADIENPVTTQRATIVDATTLATELRSKKP